MNVRFLFSPSKSFLDILSLQQQYSGAKKIGILARGAFHTLNQASDKQNSYPFQWKIMQPKLKTQIANQLRSLYGFNKIHWIDQIGGFSALNHELDADESRFILKKYRSKKESDITRIERVTRFLYSHNMPVVLPLPSKLQECHFTLGSEIFSLFPKTEGEILHEPTLSKQALSSTASLLAKMHRLDASSLDLEKLKDRILSQETIEKNAQQTLSMVQQKSLGKEIDELTKKLIKEKLRSLNNLTSRDLFNPYMIYSDFVHGDFHNENLLFDKNGNIVRLLDFEETHYGHRIEDVIHFILLGCCNTGFANFNLEKARFFIQAYSSLFPITIEEIAFGIHYELFKEWSSFFLEQLLYQSGNLLFENLIKRELKKINYFNNHLNSFIQSLAS